mgnify:CR=1 FL=1
MEESLAKRLNKRLAESETFNNEGGRGESPFSLSGGSMPAPPPESGMPTPKGAFARLGLNKKTDYGDFGIGGTGISLETPQGDKINKYAATDVNYKKDGLRIGLNKGTGGRAKPNLTVGFGGTFKKGGTVRSKASKRADGIAKKGFTRAK